MKILFCNIAWMNEYKGITEEDEPQGGGLCITAQGYQTESESVEGTAQVEGCILWVWTVECLVCTGAGEE